MEGRHLDVRLQGSTAEERGVLRVYLAVTDITVYKTRDRELEREVQEKETVIREMNHRIKNNLNMISSAINLQKNSEENEKIRSALGDADARIKAVELIHERIFPSPSVDKIDTGGYLEGLLDAVFTMHNVRDIDLAAEIDQIVLPMKRLVVLGLIVSELVTNALKYGFKGEPNKELYIGLKQEPEGYVLRVKNNGAPIPEEIDIDTADSLGLSLIRTLTGQLKGEAEIRRGNSTEVVVRFPEEPAGEEPAGEEPAVNEGAAVRGVPVGKRR
jgi:two-component sensor histidine kinase